MAALPKAFWPLTIVAGVNDALHLMVGATPYTATVAVGTYYSPASLAAAVQSALTAAVANAWTVSVSQQGRFTIAGTSAFMLSRSSGRNLLLWSQQFDNAAWQKINATVTANATTAPGGAATADKLAEDATAGAHHRLSYVPGVAISAGVHTFSIYAKAAERSLLALRIGGTSQANFNLATGQVGVTNAATGRIEDLGGGWFRSSVTATAVGGETLYVNLLTADGLTLGYSGVAGNGLYLWQAQLEAQGAAGAVALTTSAAVASTDDLLPPVLGFSESTALAASLEAPHQHQNGWYADRPIGADSKPWFKRTIGQTVAFTGKLKQVRYAEQEFRTLAFNGLPAWKAKVAREGGRNNEALERLWRDGSARFRWWDDASVEGTFVDLALEEAAAKEFNPKRATGKELYSIEWILRRYVP